MLLVSMLGILASYRGNLEKLIENSNGARTIVTMEKQDISENKGIRGLYCDDSGCEYKSGS